MSECFEFFDLKSCIMTSFDKLPLDVDFGHLLTGYNFSDRPRDGDNDGNNDWDNGGGGGRERFAEGCFSEQLSILGLNFKRSRYGGVTLMCNQDTDVSHIITTIRTARPSQTCRIPPVAIYWWWVYPQECSAYTRYPPCPTFTHYPYQIDLFVLLVSIPPENC